MMIRTILGVGFWSLVLVQAQSQSTFPTTDTNSPEISRQLRGPKGGSIPIPQPRRLNRRKGNRPMKQRNSGVTLDYLEALLDDAMYDVDGLDSSSKNKKAKGRKRKNNKKSSKSSYEPRVGDIAFLDPDFFDDGFFDGEDDCELVRLNDTFSVNGPDLFLAPDTSLTSAGDPQLPGTVFIFENQPLLEPDGSTEIDGTMVSGTCTRTTMGTTSGGLCNLVFVDDAGFSITVTGSVFGTGGPMAIVGGTGGLVGVTGEMDFQAVFSNATATVDIFLDAERYDVAMRLGLIVCPEHYE